MKSVEIYTTPTCGYCAAAKRSIAANDLGTGRRGDRRPPDSRWG